MATTPNTRPPAFAATTQRRQGWSARSSPVRRRLNYDPPAPIAQVSLHAANAATVDDVLMLLDTGADTTLLPRSVITRLGITPDPTLADD